jgi:hypothetical protein
LVTFPVPDNEMRDYMRPILTALPEDYEPGTVGAGFPNPTDPDFNGYHLQVELEAGNTDDYPVTERSQLRFNFWAPKGKPTHAKQGASLVMAYVSTASDDWLAGATILGGRSDAITDPDTGYEMCWFLARVDLLATPLAS